MKNLIFLSFSLAFISHSLLGSTSVSDPLYPKQWALENQGQVILKDVGDFDRIPSQGIVGLDIHWVDTKNIPSPKKELVVAVVDSGVDIEHPDLKEQIWFNEKLCAKASAEEAKKLACYGYNYLNGNSDVSDDDGHGTHVSGIIAASRNSIGVAGAADPRVKIMPLKVLSKDVKSFVYNGKVITNVIAEAITFAVKNGAEVINLSLGWPKLIDLEAVKKAFELAEANNVTIVAAAGNNAKDLPTFPCSYENVICVGGVDNRGELTDFTNYGAKIDVVSPSQWIVSTYPQALESRVLRIKNYEVKQGTSQGAPYVTAAIANLKLLHPNLTNDQVRNLLFRSSKRVGLGKSNQFVKFGMIDMKELLALAEKKEETAFINPQIKSLTEIKFTSSERKFSLGFDLKNTSALDYKGVVCFRLLSKAIELDQNCMSVEIAAQKSFKVFLTGRVQDLAGDSHVILQIQVDERLYQTNLVFTRSLEKDASVMSAPIAKGNFLEMGIINPGRKISKMTRVFDKHRQLPYPEYFYVESLNQTETHTRISLVTKYDQKYLVRKIEIPKVNKVLSIHRQDINLDGKLDYFIYSLSAKKDELLFHLFDENLLPLFDSLKSVWSFKLSTFEGLPIDGGMEKFEWLKVKSAPFGDVLVPSIYRSYAMPEDDNSKNISDRVLSAMSHQYYLNPVEKDRKIEMQLRVVDSAAMMKSLRQEMGIARPSTIKTVYLLKPFPQTLQDLKKGRIQSLIGTVENGRHQLFQAEIHLEGNHYSNLRSLHSNEVVDESLIYPVVSSQNGEVQDDAIFTTLLNRATAEFLVKSDEGIETSPLVLGEGWENPIISLMGIFSDPQGAKSYFVENRSTLTLLGSDGEKKSLPIYRDSSFPGQTFSEIFTPILSDGRPGIYVNSTLIYGERLYSMVDTEDHGFIRPLKLSVELPANCVPLQPETLGEKEQFYYVFLCTDPSNQASLKFLPMSHL